MFWQWGHLYSALRHRNFRLFVPGQFISLIGFWMQSVAQSWLIYRLTHSPAWLGAAAFAQQIPILLLTVPAGGIVDRMDRHRLILVTQSFALAQATVFTILVYTGTINISSIMILSVLLGLISAFDLPARQSFLVQMVSKEDLMNAIALNSSLFNGARMIGPAIAGFIIARWGEGPCFLFNAVSYGAVLIALMMMSIQRTAPVREKSLMTDLMEGFRFIRETRPVRVLLGLIGAFGIAGFSFNVLLPVFADRVFLRGAAGLGWLVAALGLGAFLGALFLAGRKGFKGISKVITSGAFGFSLCLLFFSMSTWFWLSFMLLCLAGFFMMIMIAAVNTAIQSIIPDHLRGRVMSFFTTMLIGMAPVGQFASGIVAKWIGVQLTVFIAAMICLAAAISFKRVLPGITTETRRLYLLQNPTSEILAGR